MISGIFMQALGAVGREAGRQTSQADLSSIGFLAPILVFLLVFIVLAAFLYKSEILSDNIWISVFTALIIAGIFASAENMLSLLQGIVPWFAVLMITLFLILLLTSFVSDDATPKRFLAWMFVVAMVTVFIMSMFGTFAGPVSNYLPGASYGSGGSSELLIFTDWFYLPHVFGTFWLVIFAAAVGWVLIKFGGEKKSK